MPKPPEEATPTKDIIEAIHSDTSEVKWFIYAKLSTDMMHEHLLAIPNY